MKKSIIILVLSFLAYSNSIAQNVDSTQALPKKHYVGIGAGFSSGLGFSYKYKPNKWGFQLNFFPANEKSYYVHNDFLSVGFMINRYLSESKYTDLFIYFGNHFLYDFKKEKYLNQNSSTPTSLITKNQKSVFTGIGAGIDGKISKSLSITLAGGFGYYFISKEERAINLIGEFAFHYKF